MIRISKAKLYDIPQMQKLVENEVKEGIILPRSDDEVATNIRSYILAKDGDRLIGYGALHIHSPSLAEIRSLIVDREYRGRGVGIKIVKFCIEEAKELGVESVLVLTYLPQFFQKMGFEEIEKTAIPEHKIWADCIKCIHFPKCDEVSLIYKVEGAK